MVAATLHVCERQFVDPCHQSFASCSGDLLRHDCHAALEEKGRRRTDDEQEDHQDPTPDEGRPIGVRDGVVENVRDDERNREDRQQLPENYCASKQRDRRPTEDCPKGIHHQRAGRCLRHHSPLASVAQILMYCEQ